MEIKVGDWVAIRPDSQWYTGSGSNPKCTIGRVISNKPAVTYLGIKVQWPVGQNSYSAGDLEVVNTEDEILTMEMIYGIKIKR